MCEPRSAGELDNIVFESMKTVIPKTKRLIPVAPTNFLRYFSTISHSSHNMEYLDFKITPNNQNILKIQIKTILELIEKYSEYFKPMGIRMNIIVKIKGNTERTLGGPYGSTFLHLKGIKRSEEEFSYLIDFINEKILYSQESYTNNNQYEFESTSYISSIYIAVLEPVMVNIADSISTEYNSLCFKANYTINTPNGKRSFHTSSYQCIQDTEGNEKRYDNFVNSIVLNELLPDDFMTLVNVKNLDENIYNHVIECCMDESIDVDLSSFRNYSKQKLIRIKEIKKHIEGIRVVTSEPNLKKLKN